MTKVEIQLMKIPRNIADNNCLLVNSLRWLQQRLSRLVLAMESLSVLVSSSPLSCVESPSFRFLKPSTTMFMISDLPRTEQIYSILNKDERGVQYCQQKCEAWSNRQWHRVCLDLGCNATPSKHCCIRVWYCWAVLGMSLRSSSCQALIS